MTRTPPRDLEPTLVRPGGASVRATTWQEITDPSLNAGPAVQRTAPDEPPQPRIGRYIVLRRLGSGGMGVVYAAFDDSLDRKIAIKVLRDRDGDPEGQARLLREAQALARLSHPNVVAVHDVGTTADGQVYIAMEFITGVTLRSWLEELPRPRAEVLRVFLQAGRGLAAAHAVGLIHRDFKPDNVMVGNDGRVCVFDFGLARSEREGDAGARDPAEPLINPLRSVGAVTITGTVLGTPGYMALEQHDGRPTDARTDVFSFCVALYEALYGERPFAGATYGELIASVRAGAVRPAPLGVAVPAWLRQIVVRGLEPVPLDRWPDMPTLLAALTADPAAARRRALRIGLLLMLVAAVAAAVPYLWSEVRGVWARERSESIAAHRWQVVHARIAALELEGQPGEADAAFTAFVHADEHRGTRALTHAWLDRGARRVQAGDRDDALAAFARAYTEAGARDLEVAAMRAMAGVFRDEWAWEPLAQALAALRARGASDDPDIASLGVDEALIHRDLHRARDLLDELGPRAPADLAAVRPLLLALGDMTPTGLPGLDAVVVDLDRDGRQDLVLVDASRRILTQVDHDLRVLRRDRMPAPVTHLLPGPRAVLYDGQRTQLYRLAGGPRLTWQRPTPTRPYTAAVLDLGGRGHDDLYLGFEPPDRRFLALPDLDGVAPDAPLQPAHPSTEAANSDIEALLAADLDGDGTREVLAGVGAWTAYDLRVFQPGPAGLELRAHRRFGRIAGVTVLHDAAGAPRIAVAKDDIYPNREIFPAPPHTGAPAGVYLLRWTGAALVEDGFVAFPRTDGRAALSINRTMLAGDLDGDGLDDLVLAGQRHADHAPEDQRDVTLILRQRSDGSFVTAALGGVIPVGLFDADADPARELLAYTRERPDELWILGAGADVMPPLPRPTLALIAAPPELDDPLLARDWERASQLERVGLSAAAASTLRDAAHFARNPVHRLLMLDRAGDVLLALGDDAAAGALFRQVAASPHLAPAALARAAEADARLGRYADAHAALATLVALPEASAAQVQAAQARLVELEPMARPTRTLHLDFERPLDRAWRIEDPTAVRRDPADGVLRVTTFPGQGELAALPIAWDGGPLRLQIDLAREHLELGASLRVVVRDDQGSLWLGAGLRASGGGGLVDQGLQCFNRLHSAWDPIDTHPQATATAPARLHLRVEYLPGIGPITCASTDGDGDTHTYRGPAAAPPPPGRYWLAIGGFPDRPIDLAMARAAIHGIRIEGADLITTPDLITTSDRADPLAAARHSLADADPLAALVQLAAAAQPDPRRPLWEAVARDDLHDGAGTLDALRRAAPADPDAPVDPALLRLLRLRPESIAVALREVLGPRFFAVYDAAWGQAIHHHRYDPFLHRRLTADLVDLDAFVPRLPADWALKFRLLALRGRSWLRLGATDRARQDLRAAAAMLPRVPSADGNAGHLVAVVWILAAKVTAAEDPAEALGYARIAVAASPTPELVAEQLRSDPDLGAFQGDPAWAGVFDPGGRPSAPASPRPIPTPPAPRRLSSRRRRPRAAEPRRPRPLETCRALPHPRAAS